jgi:hypothetical protein
MQISMRHRNPSECQQKEIRQARKNMGEHKEIKREKRGRKRKETKVNVLTEYNLFQLQFLTHILQMR